MNEIDQGFFIEPLFTLVRILVAWVLLFLVFRLFMKSVLAIWLTNSLLLSCFMGAVYVNLGFYIDLYDEAGFKELLICQIIALNTFTLPLLYWLDKYKAKTEAATRIPEAILHLFAYLGGAAGALVAQTAFRHKTTKVGFRRTTWLALLLNIAMFYLLVSYL